MVDSSDSVKSKKMTVSAATSRLISIILKMSPNEILEMLETVEEKELEKKRRSPRVNYFMEVNYVVEGKAFNGYINNISSKGVFIETKELFQLESSITLTFLLPNSNDHIRADGKIVRLTPDGIGISFDLDIQTLLDRQKEGEGSTTKIVHSPLL